MNQTYEVQCRHVNTNDNTELNFEEVKGNKYKLKIIQMFVQAIKV